MSTRTERPRRGAADAGFDRLPALITTSLSSVNETKLFEQMICLPCLKRVRFGFRQCSWDPSGRAKCQRCFEYDIPCRRVPHTYQTAHENFIMCVLADEVAFELGSLTDMVVAGRVLLLAQMKYVKTLEQEFGYDPDAEQELHAQNLASIKSVRSGGRLFPDAADLALGEYRLSASAILEISNEVSATFRQYLEEERRSGVPLMQDLVKHMKAFWGLVLKAHRKRNRRRRAEAQ